MKLTRIISAFFVVPICVALAQAQSARTFVSAHGVDNSDCGSFDLPCRSFGVALTKTNAGGEVIALDSGIYDNSNIVISRAVTLAAAPGAHVELSNAVNQNARITVNTAGAGTVMLRNLYLSRHGGGGPVNGISVSRVGTLQIENCVIDGFDQGIDAELSTSAILLIHDTLVRKCIGDGILMDTTAGLIKASIDHCRFVDNGANGIQAFRNTRVTVRNSIAVGNGLAGFSVDNGGNLNLENCEASGNQDGVQVSDFLSPGAVVVVSNSIVTNNGHNGFIQSGGVFQSLGNNVVRHNGTNTAGTITLISGT